MTQTAELLSLVVEALKEPLQNPKGATLAEDRVYSALDWPTSALKYPCIYCATPIEEKTGLGRNGPPQFDVVATLRIEARTEIGALPNGQSAAMLQRELGVLGDQIQVAIINNPSVMGLLQQVSFIRTEQKLSAVGDREMGEIQVLIGLEFYQGPEDFYPLPTWPLESIAITVDLVAPFDPTATFPDAKFPDSVKPAPRTSGPDGHAEAEILITLNSEAQP